MKALPSTMEVAVPTEPGVWDGNGRGNMLAEVLTQQLRNPGLGTGFWPCPAAACSMALGEPWPSPNLHWKVV